MVRVRVLIIMLTVLAGYGAYAQRASASKYTSVATAYQQEGVAAYFNGARPGDGASICNYMCRSIEDSSKLSWWADDAAALQREAAGVRNTLSAGELRYVKVVKVGGVITAFYVGWQIGTAGRWLWQKVFPGSYPASGGWHVGTLIVRNIPISMPTWTPASQPEPVYTYQVLHDVGNVPWYATTVDPANQGCESQNPPVGISGAVNFHMSNVQCHAGGPLSELDRKYYFAPARVDPTFNGNDLTVGDSTFNGSQVASGTDANWAASTETPADALGTDIDQQVLNDPELDNRLGSIVDPNNDGSPADGPADGITATPTQPASEDDTAPAVPGGSGSCEPWVRPNVNFAPLNLPYGAQFPLGVPLWLYATAESWSSTGAAPTFTIPFTRGDLVIDLDQVSPVIDVVRPLLLIGAIVGLMFSLAGWALGSPGSSKEAD